MKDLDIVDKEMKLIALEMKMYKTIDDAVMNQVKETYGDRPVNVTYCNTYKNLDKTIEQQQEIINARKLFPPQTGGRK